MDELEASTETPKTDDAQFHLPVPALFADFDAGSGAVRPTEAFLSAPAHLRHRVLRDWLKALRAESDRALVDLFRDFTEPLDRLSIVEQVDLFRRSCRDRDIAVPTDFAVLLQRV